MASASGSEELSLCHLVPLVPPHPGVLRSDPWHGDRVPTAVLASHSRGLVLGLGSAVLLGRWDLVGLQKAGEPQAWGAVLDPGWEGGDLSCHFSVFI